MLVIPMEVTELATYLLASSGSPVSQNWLISNHPFTCMLGKDGKTQS